MNKTSLSFHMKIDIKLRCYPDSQLKQLIHQTAGNNRFIYNYFLKLKNTRYQENKTSRGC